MNHRVLILTLTLTFGLTMPAAVAGWSGYGSNEPSTSYDTADVMTQDANTGAGEYVYFNAYPVQTYGLVTSSYNPNMGQLDTGNRAFGVLTFNAMLGVWRDCNGDGYVGLGDTASSNYRQEQLELENKVDVCPIGESQFADGKGWVMEYLPFAMLHPCTWSSDEDRAAESGTDCEGYSRSDYGMGLPGVIFVNNTRVWGDSAKPDHKSESAPGGTCSIRPMPRGTTSSSGLLLRQLSCSTGLTGAINNANRIVLENTTVDLGLAFDNPNQPQESEGHPLNFGLPVNLYGNPQEGQEGRSGIVETDAENGATFSTWDCSADSRNDIYDPTASEEGQPGMLRNVTVEDPTGGELSGPIAIPSLGTVTLFHAENHDRTVNITEDDGLIATWWNPAPSLGAANGSVWDAGRHTYDGSPLGDCDPENGSGLGGSPGQGELDSNTTTNSGQITYKQGADWMFRFNSGVIYGDPGQNGAPDDPNRGLGAMPYPSWTAASLLLGVTPVTGGVRADLSKGDPAYYSFYATVDRAEIESLNYILPGVDQQYGSAQCDAGFGTGLFKNGWDCDDEAWYTSAAPTGFTSTNSTAPKMMWEYTPRVGQFYQLRDVDCFDSRVMGNAPPTVNPCTPTEE